VDSVTFTDDEGAALVAALRRVLEPVTPADRDTCLVSALGKIERLLEQSRKRTAFRERRAKR
jgi:predicted DNA-binding transcriptional regulator YafY